MSNSTQPFVRPGEPLHEFLRSFWQRQIDAAEQETPDYRHPPLPLARIKKVMKSDPEVKMIAADAPILFCKACEIFIAEITARAFIIADSNKRRTLSRADIAKAISKSDQFDFLIDIVPRDEPFGAAGTTGNPGATGTAGGKMTKKNNGMVAKSESNQEDNQGPSSTAAVGGIMLEGGTDTGGSSNEVPTSVVLDQLQTLLNPPGNRERS
ncbi:histone-fold-containing protein [Abortiporus biennis]|nr:histone-fold-containing protein [Abortiporus biennis]